MARIIPAPLKESMAGRGTGRPCRSGMPVPNRRDGLRRLLVRKHCYLLSSSTAILSISKMSGMAATTRFQFGISGVLIGFSM